MSAYLTCWDQTEVRLRGLLREGTPAAVIEIAAELRDYRQTLPTFDSQTRQQRSIDTQILRVIVVCLQIEWAA